MPSRVQTNLGRTTQLVPWLLIPRYYLPQLLFHSETFPRISASVFALACVIHNAPTRAKQANLHGVGVQVQDFSNFLDGEPFYLFQNEHHAVAFVQALEQKLDLLLGLELVGNVLRTALHSFAGAELLGLFFAEIRFIDKRPNLFLS